MSLASADQPTVFGIERVNNPHILPIFDELYRQPCIAFAGCILNPLPPGRIALGWPELDEKSPYLQRWRSPENAARYEMLVKEAHLVIWPGLKHPRGLRLLRWRNRRRKPNLIWAERFILRRRRPWYETLAMRATVRLVNSPNMHLMTMGEGAERDYRRYGATRWHAWRFGYAVQPRMTLDHDLAVAPFGSLRLLFVGELSHRKGVDILIRALGRQPLAAAPWHLSVVGDGPARESLRDLATKLGIAGKTAFQGVVPRGRMDEIYAGADVLVLPSRFDGWGAAINEAMEHGLAIVASDAVGAASTLVNEGVNGYVFPNEDVAALSERLSRVVTDRPLVSTMRQASRERIERFRPAEAARRVVALCLGLTGRGPMPDFKEGLCQSIH